jgi:hypothetical protein
MARTTAVITAAQNTTITTVIAIQLPHPQPLLPYHIIIVYLPFFSSVTKSRLRVRG